MTGNSWLVGDLKDQFRHNYNKANFSFAHRLTGNSLFELQHLVEYARGLPPDPKFAFWSNGKVNVGDTWDGSAGPRYSLQDSIANIAENNSLVLLKRIETAPVFAPLMRDLMATLTELSGPAMRDDIIVGRGTLLVASPRRITSYHIDADTNFLLQITGNKLITVYNQTDRTLISDVELEEYYAGDANGARFKESRQHEGTPYDLKAGTGVHIPSMAPHWAQNDDNLSIALSINFDLRSIARLARIYRLNRLLRRYGLRPTPPGVSSWRDLVKHASCKGFGATRRLMLR